MTLKDWIEQLVKSRYGTTRALALAIGMTESGFSRAVKAGTFEVENLLKLADETGEAAGHVFDMAGKPHVNSLVEKLYGKARPAKDPDAAKAAEMMSKILDADAREGLLLMMRGYLKAQQQALGGGAPAIRETRRR